MRSETTRTISGRVNADGSGGGPGVVSQKIGAGLYQLMFTGGRLVSITANGIDPNYAVIAFDTWTATSVRVRTANAGATGLVDCGFVFQAGLAA